MCSVVALGSQPTESSLVQQQIGDEIEHSSKSIQLTEQSDSPASNGSQQDESNFATPVSKKKSMKGRPRVPTAIDTSRLNKHLTAVWGAKRKRSARKMPAAALETEVNDESAAVYDSERNKDRSDEESELKTTDECKSDPMASTVIILKTVPRQAEELDVAEWSYGNESVVDVEMEFVDNAVAVNSQPQPVKASRDIAERLKARKRKFTETSLDTTKNSSGSANGVSCELCGEVVASYGQLVQHVTRQHEDCTFVRNYLDEIKPLAATQSAVSLPCNACGRTFSGKTALSAHKYECHGSARSESKLGALRRHVKAAAASKTDVKEERSDRLSCKNCNKKFKSAEKLMRHEQLHVGGGETETPSAHACKHCGKKFYTRDNLLKHVKRVHGLEQYKADGKNGEGRMKNKPRTTPKAVKAGNLVAASSSESSGVRVKSGPAPKISQSNASGSENDLHEFACNHCKTVFGRMTLLVTHMRYCIKADGGKR
jgi:hypothetical protein